MWEVEEKLGWRERSQAGHGDRKVIERNSIVVETHSVRGLPGNRNEDEEEMSWNHFQEDVQWSQSERTSGAFCKFLWGSHSL